MPYPRCLSFLLPALLSAGYLLAATPVAAHAPAAMVIEPVASGWQEQLSWTETDDAPALPQAAPALARFGPFHVTGATTADMIGVVDSHTPRQFAAMLKAYPAIGTLRMIECPGSEDDEANLKLARMLRAARIETVVPAGGSVRSGAVELFLAGVRRRADSQAEFAVHSWRDSLGREADDLPPDDPVHSEYIEFYREMGLSEDRARQFYALTSSVAFDDALYVAPLHLAAMGLLDVI